MHVLSVVVLNQLDIPLMLVLLVEQKANGDNFRN